MGATSRPDLIDPAVLRPGRLDKILLCDFPNQEERYDVLKLYYEKSQASCEDIRDVLDDNQSQLEALKYISENTQYYTGADLQSLIYNAFLLSVKRNIEMKKDELAVINASDLKVSFKEFRKSISEKEIKFYDDIKNKFILRINSFDQSSQIDLSKIDMKTTLY